MTYILSGVLFFYVTEQGEGMAVPYDPCFLLQYSTNIIFVMNIIYNFFLQISIRLPYFFKPGFNLFNSS